MRDFLSRLRAALSPQVLLALAALIALASGMSGREGNASSLERRASQALSAVEGAGEVHVVIKLRENSGGYAAQGKEAIPVGALAVAQGADDPLVHLALEEALCALLGLPPSCVSIVTGGK